MAARGDWTFVGKVAWVGEIPSALRARLKEVGLRNPLFRFESRDIVRLCRAGEPFSDESVGVSSDTLVLSRKVSNVMSDSSRSVGFDGKMSDLARSGSAMRGERSNASKAEVRELGRLPGRERNPSNPSCDLRCEFSRPTIGLDPSSALSYDDSSLVDGSVSTADSVSTGNSISLRNFSGVELNRFLVRALSPVVGLMVSVEMSSVVLSSESSRSSKLSGAGRSSGWRKGVESERTRVAPDRRGVAMTVELVLRDERGEFRTRRTIVESGESS